MSYQPFDRKASGIVFFGSSPTDQVYESVATFTYDTGNNSLKLADGGFLGSQSYYNALSIASNGNATFAQNLSIGGDLTVNGTTTTVNSTVVTIQDPIIILGSGSPTTDDNKDRGIAFNWHNGSTAKTGWFGYDDSVGKFTFIPDATIASEVVSGTSGIIVATLEGNASTSTQLLNSRNFSMTGEMTAGAVAFDGTANVVLTGVLHQTAISSQSEITSVNDVGTDYILIWDDTDDDLKKITRANFVSGLGSMSSFTISDLGGNTQTISDSNTLAFAPGVAITFTVSATDTVSGTLSSNVAGNGLTMASQILAVGAGNGISVASDSVAVTAGSGISVDLNGVHVNAGTGLLNTAAGLQIGVGNGITGAADAISVTSGSGISVDLNGVHVNAGTGLLNTAAGLQIGIGNGITGAADAISVTDGSGILVNSNGVHANLISYTSQAVAANAASSTASRTYPIQVNSSDQLVVNVPWTDADTTYTASSGLVLTGTAFSVKDGSGILIDSNGVHTNVDNNTIKISNATDQLYINNAPNSRVTHEGYSTSVSMSMIDNQDLLLCDGGAGGITISLPSGVQNYGRLVRIKKADTGAGPVTISGVGYTFGEVNGISLIDGANTYKLYNQYESVTLVNYGYDWHVV